MAIEILLGLGLYSIVAYCLSFFFTSAAYKQLLVNLKPEWDKESVGPEKHLELEAKRRKQCANIARSYGLWFSIFWCIVLPIEILMSIRNYIALTVTAISISKHDEDFLNEKQELKTKQILEEYEKSQEEQFDKELNS